MTSRPILFSAPMVRALLDGSKTQTRRIAKVEKTMGHDSISGPRINRYSRVFLLDRAIDHRDIADACPYGKPGDQLWVRETWCREFEGGFNYRADDMPGDKADFVNGDGEPVKGTRWKPSIHMPRAASRITLEITGVRVERLQAISEADAKAEGAPLSKSEPCHEPEFQSHTLGFWRLWESINGPASWAANPFVWAVSFKRITP